MVHFYIVCGAPLIKNDQNNVEDFFRLNSVRKQNPWLTQWMNVDFNHYNP